MMNNDELKLKQCKERISSLLDTNEINRVHRAAKNKDKNEIKKWAKQFEESVNEKYYEIYKKQYMEWIYETFKDIDIAICYTLHFNEATKFGNKRLKSFMDDINVVFKGFYKEEFSREEYKKHLTDDGINLI